MNLEPKFKRNSAAMKERTKKMDCFLCISPVPFPGTAFSKAVVPKTYGANHSSFAEILPYCKPQCEKQSRIEGKALERKQTGERYSLAITSTLAQSIYFLLFL